MKILKLMLILCVVSGCDTFVGPSLLNATDSELLLYVEYEGYSGAGIRHFQLERNSSPTNIVIPDGAGVWRLQPNQEVFLGGRPKATNTLFQTAVFYLYDADTSTKHLININELPYDRGIYYLKKEKGSP